MTTRTGLGRKARRQAPENMPTRLQQPPQTTPSNIKSTPSSVSATTAAPDNHQAAPKDHANKKNQT